MKLSDFNLLDDQHDDLELNKILEAFNATDANFPDKTLVELFEEQAEKFSDKTALIFGNSSFTYGELSRKANQYAHFLLENKLKTGEIVALIFDKSPEMIFSILGVIKAGAVYLPLDPQYPFERLKFTLEDSKAGIILSQKNHIKLINKLQWECPGVKVIASVDSENFHTEKEDLNELMKTELWDYISEKSHDDISGGGWFSSYTGEDIPREEMDEYSQNVFLKLEPHLNSGTKVLEIGCSFGITMFNVARQVKSYYGTDLSGVAIEKTTQLAQETGATNVTLEKLAAHEIDQVRDSGFDVVIINSVVQLFNGHNYLRDVLRKCVDLMSDKGVIFLGDLQDQDKKQELIDSLKKFSRENQGKGYSTKTDWSNELFIAKDFLSDLLHEFDEFEAVSFSDKIHTLKNELTEFRFDSLLSVNKSGTQENKTEKNKSQFGSQAFIKQKSTDPEVKILPSANLYVIYTSGSTGLPKGCKITHRNVVRLLFNDKLDFTFSDQDVWIMAHSYYFDFSVWEMYGALLYGGKLILPPSEDVKDMSKLHHLVKKHRVSVFNQTPLSFNYFIQEEQAQQNHQLNEHLRYVIFGGDKLDPRKLVPWTEYYKLSEIKLINMYGITETTVHVTYYEISEQDLKNKGISPIGRPLPETKIYILNEQLKALPIGIVGEMFVGGSGVCAGYLNREELTKERFIPNPFVEGEILYKTGDQAKWLENGMLEYQGRIDFQVKIRGYRIELGEVESILNSHPQISEAVVVARQKNGENELVAYYVSALELDIKVLRDFLKLDLPDFMLPSFFIKIDSIPLTSNGKLNKSQLPDPYLIQLNSGENYLEASSESEKLLVQVWSEVLGVSPIGIRDNFFSIGGDSLKAIRAIVQINKKLGTSIKVSDIFNFQTIEGLAKKLDAQEFTVTGNEAEKGYRKIAEIKGFIENNNREDLPENYEDIYPLTSIEKGMIFSSMLRSDEPVYYDQFTYRLNIKSEAVFRKAFELMLGKHPILRSLYYMNSFLEPVKIVLKESDLPLDFEDLSSLEAGEKEQKINSYMKDDAEKRLDFEGDLLWHLKAFFLGNDHFFIIWTVHHAILDGWSESSFVTEFANLCADPNVLTLSEIPKLASSYRDYTAINISRSVSASASDFWKNHLESYSRNKLPFNLSGKKISRENGMKRIGKRFDPELSLQIEQLKNEEQITYKAIFLAAYAYLMHLLSSENEVVSGCVSNDRPEIEDGDKILGCFLNTIPFKVDFTELKNRQELLKLVSGFLNEVKQHEIYLLDIAHIIGEKSSSGNPVFDCIFNYTDFHILDDLQEKNEALTYSDPADEKLELRQNNLMTNTLFDVEVDRTGGNLTVGIKFALAYFREDDVTRAIELYENILRSFINDLNLPLNASGLLSEKEKNYLLNEFNDTITDFPSEKLLHQLFEDAVSAFPEHIALRQNGKTLSYEALNKEANQLANLLLKNGVKAGENVGLISERNFGMIAALFGILKAGAAYVPVDPSYPLDRQLYILENSACKLILCDQNYEIRSKIPDANFISFTETSLTGFSTENLSPASSPKDLAYTIYTSGSTGRPKGVMIEHQSAVNLINWVNKRFEISEKDRLLFITSICFDLSVYDIFGILASGASLVIASQEQIKDPEILQQIMLEEKITFWDSVPSTMNYLVDMIELSNPAYRQTDLRLVFMSGDWIPVNLPDKIVRFFPNAQNISLGGATEGTVWSNYYPINGDVSDFISIPYGKPIDNNFFYILDDTQNPVPMGVSGELYIGGNGVAVGYANDTEKTRASFFYDPFSKLQNARMYKTGDLGRMMADGNMEFLGRKDFQVKIRGYRVELGEIENQLQQNPLVRRAIVLAKEDQQRTKTLIAYVVMKNQEMNVGELKKQLALSLPEYMIPSVFIPLNQIPLTGNGKIDRNALPDHSEFLEEKEIRLPKSGTESEIAAIWLGILGLETIGSNQSVFELGAHSLHAGAFVSRLHKKLKRRIQLKDLFLNPSITEQAALIDGTENRQVDHSEIKAIPKSEHYELSHGQKRLWTIDQIQDGKTPEYNLPANFLVRGTFDPKVFEKAVQAVIQRHAILRTRFVSIDHEPRQLVSDEMDFKLELLDYSNQEDAEARISEQIKNNTLTPFDLKLSPLFRLVGMKKSGKEFVLSFVMHHIISDGWSMGIMLDEVMRFYHAFVSGEDHQPEALNIQYADFAAWQTKLIEDEAKTYWLNHLSGKIPELELPTYQQRPADSKHLGTGISHTFSEETGNRIQLYCKEKQLTPFMFLNGILAVILHKYSGQTDLLLGSPVAGRTHADLSRQIGFYVNTLALRTRITEEDSLQQILLQSRENILNALNHQNYPYDKLVEDLHIKRQRNRNPLFDVLLVMQNTEEENTLYRNKAQDLSFEPIPSQNNSSKFDLSFNFFLSSRLYLNLEYDTELFDESFIRILIGQFEHISRLVIEDDELKIAEIRLKPTVRQGEKLQTEENELEEEVLSLFRKITGNQSILREDTLLESGGDYLAAQKIRKQLDSLFGMEIPLFEILQKNSSLLADLILEKQMEEFGDENLFDNLFGS